MTTRTPALFFLCAAAALAQQGNDTGAQIFRTTCAVGYCHGAGGTAAKAPALLNRKFDAAFVRKVVSDGVANAGMPAWKERLKPAELEAVVAYVVTLSGGTMTPADRAAPASAATAAMPPEAVRGKALFADAARETSCSSCHVAEEAGVGVANIGKGTHTLAEIRAGGGGAGVRTLHTADGETFPAIYVDTKEGWMRVWDLTAPPPVLRSIPEAGARWIPGSTWVHRDAIGKYTDAELNDVAAYLRWLGSR